MYFDLRRDLQVLHLQGHMHMYEYGQTLPHSPRQSAPVSDPYAYLRVLSLSWGMRVRRVTMWLMEPAGVCFHCLAGCSHVPACCSDRPCQARSCQSCH